MRNGKETLRSWRYGPRSHLDTPSRGAGSLRSPAYNGIALRRSPDAMTSSVASERRLLVLCGLIPLPEMTQADVDYLFRRLVEDAPDVDVPGSDCPVIS